MPAYLFLWNPKKDPGSFTGFDRICEQAGTGSPYEHRWICPSRQPKPGDIAYMQRTGDHHNGVFARGVVMQGASEDDYGERVIGLRLDSFLPEGQELPRSEILATADYGKPWAPMASGNVIPGPVLSAIQLLWAERCRADDGDPDFEIDVGAEELVGIEGELLLRLVVHRKREGQLRRRKIVAAMEAEGRLVCEVPGCSFDFARVYGDVGVGYAQVHHLHPLASYSEEQETRLADLAIVCANCHAMIHRGGQCRELFALIQNQ